MYNSIFNFKNIYCVRLENINDIIYLTKKLKLCYFINKFKYWQI